MNNKGIGSIPTSNSENATVIANSAGWMNDFKFVRNWHMTEEVLGMLKHKYRSVPYVCILSAIYYADCFMFNKYGFTITYNDDELLFEPLDEIIPRFKNKIYLPLDILNRYDYDDIIPLCIEDYQLLSRNMIDTLDNAISTHTDICYHTYTS